MASLFVLTWPIVRLPMVRYYDRDNILWVILLNQRRCHYGVQLQPLARAIAKRGL